MCVYNCACVLIIIVATNRAGRWIVFARACFLFLIISLLFCFCCPIIESSLNLLLFCACHLAHVHVCVFQAFCFSARSTFLLQLMNIIWTSYTYQQLCACVASSVHYYCDITTSHAPSDKTQKHNSISLCAVFVFDRWRT